MLVAPKELPFHLEIPPLKELILVKGAIIGDLLTKLLGVLLEGQPEGKEFGVALLREDLATRTKCSLKGLGEWPASYEAGPDTGKDFDAWLVGEADITYAAAVKFMDE